MLGGDDLEENFVLNDSQSDSESESPHSSEGDSRDSVFVSGSAVEDEPEVVAETAAKKIKLNWREGSVRSDGAPESQMKIIQHALVAFGKYFPNSDIPFAESEINSNQFYDCSAYSQRETKSARDLCEFLRDSEFLNLSDGQRGCVKTIIVTCSSTRGMYLVKELRDFDKVLSPLPLFFHGGGRKKEQASTHETVIRSGKCSVAICLPSRLRAMATAGHIDFSMVDLLLFDLKQNEKQMNVLSMKDTMVDCLEVIGDKIVNAEFSAPKLALI